MSEIPLNRSIRLQSSDTNKSELLDFPCYSAMVNSNANQWLHFVGTGQFVGPGQQGAIVTLPGMVTAELEWAAPAGVVQPPASPMTQADIVFFSLWMPPSPGTSSSVQQTPRPYDGQAFHAPAAGTKATVTLTGVPSRRWCCASLVATLFNNGGVAGNLDMVLIDGPSGGATQLFFTTLGVDATLGHTDRVALSNLAYFGTAGNPMTLEFISAPPANDFERVTFGAYLV